MKEAIVYEPVKFYSLTFLITWVCWFISAFLSFQKEMEVYQVTLMAIGLLGPLIAASVMICGSKSSDLKQDFRNKLMNWHLIKPGYIPVTFLFMPLVLVVSILLSLFAGQSIEQLRLSGEFKIMGGLPILNLIIPFLAPALEELGWSGYGIDSLKKNCNILTATILFAVIWALWHLPLFFIKNYYHYNLMQTSIIYAVNFFISVIPLTIITNWLYYKNNRSIIAAIIFHAIAVVSSEAFQIVNLTKCIETIVLSAIAVMIIIMDKKFFFDKKNALIFSSQKIAL